VGAKQTEWQCHLVTDSIFLNNIQIKKQLNIETIWRTGWYAQTISTKAVALSHFSLNVYDS
jgi:hypothetical protein